MALKFIDTRPIPSGGGTQTLNSARQAMPGFHIRKLLLRFKLAFSAPSTFDGFTWGLASTARFLFRDNAVWIANVDFAALDFLARVRKDGLVRNGLELSPPRTSASAAEVWIEIPVINPNLRNPEDAVFPIDELGDVAVSISGTAGLAGGASISSGTVELYAEGEHLPSVILGPRPFVRTQTCDTSGVSNMPFEGAMPLEIIACQTTAGHYLSDAVSNGYYLEFDGEQVVDGIQLSTIEANDAAVGERLYAPTNYNASFSTPAAYGSYSGWAQPSNLARVYQSGSAQSLADLPSIQKAKFVAIAPNSTYMPSVRLTYCGLSTQDTAQVSQRRISIGLPPMIASSNADSSTANVDANILQKLPVKLTAR
jgi:hypothetical protein